MIKYNKDNQAYKLVSISRIKNKIYARVEKLHTEKQKIVEYRDFESGDFSFNEESKPTVQAVTETIETIEAEPFVQLAIEPVGIVEVINKTVEATTPRGKTLTFDLTDIEAFCNQYKLDVEAVNLVLQGVQKTHRKWGFVFID